VPIEQETNPPITMSGVDTSALQVDTPVFQEHSESVDVNCAQTAILSTIHEMGGIHVKIVDVYAVLLGSFRGSHLDHEVEALVQKAKLKRERRGYVSSTDCKPVVLQDTSHTGNWDDSTDAGIDWLAAERVQASWSDDKWYDVDVLERLEDGQFDCHFLATGNEGSVPSARLRVSPSSHSGTQKKGRSAAVARGRNSTRPPARRLEVPPPRSLAWHMQHCNESGKHSFQLD